MLFRIFQSVEFAGDKMINAITKTNPFITPFKTNFVIEEQIIEIVHEHLPINRLFKRFSTILSDPLRFLPSFQRFSIFYRFFRDSFVFWTILSDFLLIWIDCSSFGILSRSFQSHCIGHLQDSKKKIFRGILWDC